MKEHIKLVILVYQVVIYNMNNISINISMNVIIFNSYGMNFKYYSLILLTILMLASHKRKNKSQAPRRKNPKEVLNMRQKSQKPKRNRKNIKQIATTRNLQEIQKQDSESKRNAKFRDFLEKKTGKIKTATGHTNGVDEVTGWGHFARQGRWHMLDPNRARKGLVTAGNRIYPVVLKTVH
jgi:hypothetical protein